MLPDTIEMTDNSVFPALKREYSQEQQLSISVECIIGISPHRFW